MRKQSPRLTEPLQVIEFSLTPDTCEAIKKELDVFREQEKRDYSKDKDHGAEQANAALKTIFENQKYFPQEVITHLKALAENDRRPPIVYVIHNLPEVIRKEIPTELRDFHAQSELHTWLDQNSYADLVSRGIGAALDLKKVSGYHISQFAGRKSSDNFTALHKHGDQVSTLTGVESNGSPTRFTDFAAVLREARRIAKTQMPTVEVALLGNSPQEIPIPLTGFSEKFKDWKRCVEMLIKPRENIQTFETLVAKHTKEIIIKRGDCAFWLEDGQILHRAVQKNNLGSPDNTLERYIVAHSFNRATHEI